MPEARLFSYQIELCHRRVLAKYFAARKGSQEVKMSSSTETGAEAGPTNSGVTAQSLKSTLIEKLEATHVEIEDMSGTQILNKRLQRSSRNLC